MGNVPVREGSTRVLFNTMYPIAVYLHPVHVANALWDGRSSVFASFASALQTGTQVEVSQQQQ